MVFEGNGICLICGKLNTKFYDGIHWCDICSVKYIQDNLCSWSGNKKIDDFIKEKQQKANRPEDFFEWIPYNKFENIKNIRKEGIFTIYSAEWKDGYLEFYNERNHEIRWHGDLKVGLKCLGFDDDFLNEV